MIVLLLCALPFPEAEAPAVRSAMEALFNGEYEKADSVIEGVRRRMGSHPLPYLLRAARYEMFMSDYSTDRYRDAFLANADSALKAAEALIRQKGERAPYLMFKGAALGFRAIYYARRYYSKLNVLRALRDGKAALDLFSKAYQKDTTLYDCYLAMGVYDLAWTYAHQFVPWLRLGSRRDKAFRELNLAAERSDLFRPLALLVLAYAHGLDGNYPQAQTYLRAMRQLYPRSRFVDWAEVFIDTQTKRWTFASEAAKRLAERIKAEQPEAKPNLAEAYIYWARAQLNLGNKARARELAEEAERILRSDSDPWREGERKKVWSKLKELKGKLK